MNVSMTKVLALGCALIVSCSSKSDDTKETTPTVATPSPVPAANPTPSPEPTVQGFKFVDATDTELPVYVRGDMNGWLAENVSEELLAASRLNYDEGSGCYVGILALEAGEKPFRLATYLKDVEGAGWSHLKVGLLAAGQTTPLVLGVETKVDVYYFPAGDANGKDLGGGGNFAVNFPKKGTYEFKFCTQVADYTQSFLTVSAQ